MSVEDITNPLEYIECIIAFDVSDWSEDSRRAAIYAIVFGLDDEMYQELKDEFHWSDTAIERLKKFHEEWERLKEEEPITRCVDCKWCRKFYHGHGMLSYECAMLYLTRIEANDFCSKARRKEE